MTDFLATAPADSMSGAEFFRSIFGPPAISREEQAERALAWRECQDAMRQLDWRTKQKQLDECRARYAERLNEIAEKYGLAPVEHLGPGRVAA